MPVPSSHSRFLNKYALCLQQTLYPLNAQGNWFITLRFLSGNCFQTTVPWPACGVCVWVWAFSAFVVPHVTSLWDAVPAPFCSSNPHSSIPSLRFTATEILISQYKVMLVKSCLGAQACVTLLESSMCRPKGDSVGVNTNKLGQLDFQSFGFLSQVGVIQQSWWHF